MTCAHCLRGDAQNIDIDTAYIDQVLSEVDTIHSITFTGGEISLNPGPILYTLEKCKELDISVGQVYGVTNGAVYNEELMQYLQMWREYITICEFDCEDDIINGDDIYDYNTRVKPIIQGDAYETPPVTLAISFDEYHEDVPMMNLVKLSNFSFMNFEDKNWADRIGTNDTGRWIAEGRMAGASNARELVLPNSLEVCEYDPGDITVETLYISANGFIAKDANMSYDHIDEDNWGSLDTTSITELITEHLEVI